MIIETIIETIGRLTIALVVVFQLTIPYQEYSIFHSFETFSIFIIGTILIYGWGLKSFVDKYSHNRG